MSKIEIDTSKVKECGNNIMNLSIEINDDLNNLFSHIQKMPYNTCEWVGNAAEQYASSIVKDKIVYVQLKDIIYSMGKYLVDSATEIESNVDRF